MYLFLLDGEARCVVHADLKPENLMFGAGGGVRLVDFGSATLVDAAELRRRMEGLRAGTFEREEDRADDMEGTVAYMAPEMITGDLTYLGEDADAAVPGANADRPVSVVTPAVDLWAVGCVLHLLLMGRTSRGSAGSGENWTDAATLEDVLCSARLRGGGSDQNPSEHPHDATGSDLLGLLKNPDPRQRLGWNDLRAAVADVSVEGGIIDAVGMEGGHRYTSILSHPFFHHQSSQTGGDEKETDFLPLEAHERLYNVSHCELLDGNSPNLLEYILSDG
mmetsp:Transcript_35560/g.82584  ORF Transcript_35560/g.82584 Transcript_35560/m.82584 type:complete len:278 (-) Transcript_35560:49-882(-)